MLGELSKEGIEELLNRLVVGHLGCHHEGRTYVVPITYAYDGDYIYCRSFEGKKLAMLRANPSVCFQVDDTRDLSNWQSAICWGEFEELAPGRAYKNALDMLLKRKKPLVNSQLMVLAPDWPFTNGQEATVGGVLFRIRITEKSGRYERTSDVVE